MILASFPSRIGQTLILHFKYSYDKCRFCLIPDAVLKAYLCADPVRATKGFTWGRKGLWIGDRGKGSRAVNAALNITKILAKSPEGPSATEQVDSTVANLERDAVYGFGQQLSALGSMFDFILDDGGRIKTLGDALNNPSDPEWYWDGSVTTGQMLTVLSRAMEQSYYQSLTAVVFDVKELTVDPGDEDPGKWCSYRGITGCHYTYEKWPQQAFQLDRSWVEEKGPYDNFGPRSIIPFLHRTDGKNDGKPDGNFLQQKIFGPVSQNGLGVWKPFLFRRWPFPRTYCDPTSTDNGTCDDPTFAEGEQLGPSGWGRNGRSSM